MPRLINKYTLPIINHFDSIGEQIISYNNYKPKNKEKFLLNIENICGYNIYESLKGIIGGSGISSENNSDIIIFFLIKKTKNISRKSNSKKRKRSNNSGKLTKKRKKGLSSYKDDEISGIFVGSINSDYLESSYTCAIPNNRRGELLRYYALLYINSFNKQINSLKGFISGGIPKIAYDNSTSVKLKKMTKLIDYHLKRGAIINENEFGNTQFTYSLRIIKKNIAISFKLF